MNKNKKILIAVTFLTGIIASVAVAFWSANKAAANKVQAQDEEERVQPVDIKFNADSAYAFTAQQCAFGPRPMNTPAHERCGEWIAAQFRRLGCTVTLQQATLRGWDGTPLHATNIMASWRPEASTRILVCAHWDTRPWADNDPDEANHRKPILAANDAASGVAVMLELARLLADSTNVAKMRNGQLGVDFLCLDAEDWGTPSWSDQPDDGNSWALGAQHWAKNVPQGYAPRYGILLDMVGGEGARFYQEGMSLQFAPDIVKKVWRAAHQAGFSTYFPMQPGGMVTDDHVPINQLANIPCIDIIPYYADCPQSTFGPTWHTLQDNMDHIDRRTLQAVGQTMVQVLFSEP